MWSRSVTTGSISIVLLISRSFRAAASALGRLSRTSCSSKRICRWRLCGLDEVAVDDPEVTHAGPGEVVGQHGPERTAAAERDPALQQGALAGFAQGGEADLAGVAVERVDGDADIDRLRTRRRTVSGIESVIRSRSEFVVSRRPRPG